MDANDYQQSAARTLIMDPDTTFTNDELAIMLAALELGAKVGAVLELLKKGICHRHGYDRYAMIELLTAVVDTATNLATHQSPRQQYQLSGNEQMLIWCALGLGGEAGEVMDTISKLPDIAYHGNDLIKEQGDVAWYLAALCTLIGVPMSDVMQANIQKLAKRFPEGWGSEASKARVDTL